jgi:hypothetical protein
MQIFSHFINQSITAGSSLVFDQALPKPITSADYVYGSFLINIDMFSASLDFGI